MGNPVVKKAIQTTQYPPKYIIVICDVSPSIDANHPGKGAVSNRYQIMVNQCKSLLTAYPPNTTFSFFFVSRNGNAAPFARLKSEPVNKNNGREEMQRYNNCKNWLQQSIIAKAAQPESQSCIMTSIEAAYITLNGLAAGNNVFRSEIIVISDMVEVCWASPLDTIVMNVAKGRDILSRKAMDKIKRYQSNINFDKLDVNIRILFNAGTMDIQKEKQLENIWRLILTRYGYKAAADYNRPLFLTNYSFKKDAYYTDNNLNF